MVSWLSEKQLGVVRPNRNVHVSGDTSRSACRDGCVGTSGRVGGRSREVGSVDGRCEKKYYIKEHDRRKALSSENSVDCEVGDFICYDTISILQQIATI